MTERAAFDAVPITRVRDFWDARPCNIRHSPQPVGTRAYFEDVDQRRYFVEPHILDFADFPRWSGQRVLEIGCGIGTDTIRFAHAGAHVTAIELSEASATLTRQRADVYGLSEAVTVFVGDAEDLPSIVPVQPYDLIYSFGVIHHSPHPERIVAHLPQYLSSEGELRLMLYARISYKLFWIMKEEGIWDMGRIDELIAKNSEAQTGCPVTYTYTAETARALLAGFTVQDVRQAHIFTWDIEPYKRYEYVKAPEWAHVSPEDLAALERQLGWHLLIRATR